LKENPKGAMPGMLLFQEIYAVEEIIKKEDAKGCGSSRFGGIGGLLWNSRAKNKDGTQRGIAGG